MSPTDPRRLVLASASPARLRLLRGAGLDPDVEVSGVDEGRPAAGATPAIVAHLAGRKAEAVAARPVAAGALVLGCDSLLDVDGVAHGKPTDATAALALWERLRGATASLSTGHHLVDTRDGRCAAAVATTVVRFGEPTDAELDAYLATGEATEVAGGFTLDGRAAPFVLGVDGDPNNVIGCSLTLLRDLLAELGVGITDLWAR